MSLKCSFKLQGFQSYQFRQIYPDANNLSHWRWKRVSFQSYQFRQIYPDRTIMAFVETDLDLFQSYQFRQIYPDSRCGTSGCSIQGVSIVSIQADLSRPDRVIAVTGITNGFQSYQFRQIYPDALDCIKTQSNTSRFNRINSGRSIPTWNMVLFFYSCFH